MKPPVPPKQQELQNLMVTSRLLMDAKINEFMAFAVSGLGSPMGRSREEAHALLDAHLDSIHSMAVFLARVPK